VIDKLCPHCGKTFRVYPSQIHHQHCSTECYKQSRRVNTTCPVCQKPFWYLKSWPQQHCSKKCAAIGNREEHKLGVVYIGDKSCEICGKPITKGKVSGSRFCSQTCFGVHVSRTRTGVPRPEVSGPQPQRYKRVTKHCGYCQQPFDVNQSHAARRRFCSKHCMAQWQSQSGTTSGENNFNWRGGYAPYYGPNWLQQRRNARRRDNYTCQRCGKQETDGGKQLDVHHIKAFRLFGVTRYKKANQLANLISLCAACHKTVEHEAPTR